MQPTKLLRLAILPALLILSACQTPSAPASLDVPALQAKAVDAAKDEWCRGQVPQSLGSLVWKDATGAVQLGVTEDQYRATPEWVKTYINGNDDQWAFECEALP
jgi:hypothetical protein